MAPQLSVVVVAFDMVRELPRTLHSLSVSGQQGIDPDDYEVVVVDNGSAPPVDAAVLDGLGCTARLLRAGGSPSPAAAANLGLTEATGSVVGLVVDGARMASPGLLATARLGARLDPRAVVVAPAWHLGHRPQDEAATQGWGQADEDALLATVDWETDGYRLFEVATLARSSGRGWFGPMGESSAVFLHRSLWDELGGLDERFTSPGGGLVNHDLYRRACELDGTVLVSLLGEGTFHQFHGGATTSRPGAADEARLEYEALRGVPYRPPSMRPYHLGRLQEPTLAHLERSVELAAARRARGRTMFGPEAL